jgi:hypothetical protein
VSGDIFHGVTDPVYALIAVALGLALLAATLLPAPQHPAEDDAGIGLALLAAGCAAALAMGVLAILALPAESAVLGAIAWLLVMPCVWLARGPRPLEDWGDDEQDDDDGGSPSPDAPFAPPAPDGRPPALPPTRTPAAVATWTPAPQLAPVTATAARVQRLLAAQEAERLHAAQEAQRLLATREFERILAATTLAAPQADAADSIPAPAPTAEPLHAPAQPRARPAARMRADHRSIEHVLAEAGHDGTGRRDAQRVRRPAPSQR